MLSGTPLPSNWYDANKTEGCTDWDGLEVLIPLRVGLVSPKSPS